MKTKNATPLLDSARKTPGRSGPKNEALLTRPKPAKRGAGSLREAMDNKPGRGTFCPRGVNPGVPAKSNPTPSHRPASGAIMNRAATNHTGIKTATKNATATATARKTSAAFMLQPQPMAKTTTKRTATATTNGNGTNGKLNVKKPTASGKLHA